MNSLIEQPPTPLSVDFGDRTINELSLMFQNHQINLDPGFQRNSVWSTRDRTRLIQAIVAQYPIPGIFLYKRDHNGKLIYDVIDGKQRLETIFMYLHMGAFHNDWFYTKLDLGDGLDKYSWSEICKLRPDARAAFNSYRIQTIEVSGKLSEIIDLFVNINSTGKRLTSAERRNARFYRSKFLKEADRLVNKFDTYIRREGILSPAQIDRMKGTELFSEMLMSLHKGGIINKKTALDKAIANDDVNGNTLNRLSNEFVRTMNLVRKMYPDLGKTRFRNSAEFYSLFLLVWEMDKANLVLTDKRRNKIAFRLLRQLSTGVDELREQLKTVKPAKSYQKLYADYLLTVQGDTDSSANRERREKILKGLLVSLYQKARKDEKRAFTSEQRRILWNSDEKRKCPHCHSNLSWEDFTVDHIKAYAKGGKTLVKNAQLMCRSCNSKKGAR